MNKRGLQIAIALLGAIPVLTGIIGMLGLSDPLYASAGIPANVMLDSNLRFFAGVWLGLGISLYLLIPNIEKQTLLFRVLWSMIFLGGIGRLGEPTIADAILDRIIHNSHRIVLEGDSMRKKKASRPLTDVENSETNIN